MSDHDMSRSSKPLDEVRLAELVRGAGEPQSLPEDDLLEIRAAVKKEWQARHGATPGPGLPARDWPPVDRSSVSNSTSESSASSSSRVLPGLLAAAAALLVGVASWWLLGLRTGGDGSVTSGPVVGLVERVVGEVSVLRRGGTVGVRPSRGSSLAVGDLLETSGVASRLGLTLESGASVRLDEDTLVEWSGERALTLRRGAVYVDSEAPESQALVVSTPYGEVREVGTQFQVRVASSGLVVGVREGSVVLALRPGLDSAEHVVTAGRQLTFGDDGQLSTEEVSPSSATWDWILSVAPSFDPSGRSIADFFHWYERQTGVVVRFADAAVQARVESVAAGGGLGELEPRDVLAGVLESSSLRGQLSGGVLEISEAREDPR